MNRREKLKAFIDAGGAYSLRTEMRTAPVTEPDQNHRIGQAAQHLTATDILLRGFQCSVAAEALPYDLIADVNGLRRVQVKARAFAIYRGPRSREPAYVFARLDNSQVDLFAFVAIPERTVIYVVPSQITASCYTINSSAMRADNSKRSWEQAVKQWM